MHLFIQIIIIFDLRGFYSWVMVRRSEHIREHLATWLGMQRLGFIVSDAVLWGGGGWGGVCMCVCAALPLHRSSPGLYKSFKELVEKFIKWPNGS